MKKINFLAIVLAQLVSAQSISLIKDINPGVQGSSPQYLTKYNGNIFFSANNPTLGSEMWFSDGTADGTQVVADFLPGTAGQIPVNLSTFNNKIYYSALVGDSERPTGLYGYDLTNGIKLISENYKFSSSFYSANGKFYFNSGGFLYEMDSNESIKKVSENILPNGQATSMNGKLLFGGRPSSSTNVYYQLYSYDGTTTSLLKTINTTNTGNPQEFFYSPTLNKVFFSASDNTASTEPWISDGTAEGTYRLKDISTASQFASSSPTGFNEVGGKVIFAAAVSGTTGKELYITDGTEAGTKLLKDINPGTASSNPAKFTLLNGKLYFFANGGSNDAQIWETDGTAEGTKLSLRLNPGSTNFFLSEMIVKDNSLFVSAKLGVSPGQELYRVDNLGGTLSVTSLISNKSKVYPNPTTGEIFIDNYAKGNFELFDSSGRLVKKGKIGLDSKADVSSYPGVYQLKATSEDSKDVIIKKVIIK